MADPPLPPDFTLQKLTQAQRAFESALGSSKVFFEDLDRTGYKDKFAVNDAAHLPAGAIGPTTVEEVQAALRIANQYRLPVWPISRGKNLGYGGSAPLLSGSVVMDLSGMKKIEFDEGSAPCCSSPASASTISTTSSRRTSCPTGSRPRATPGAR